MVVRVYSSIAVETELTAGITPSTTTITVASTTGFPGTFPYTLALDFDSAGNELVDVTAAAGLSLTVTRAVDGTAASSHNSGAVVRHVASGRDHADSRAHENASTNVHGLAGGAAVVGTSSTQTLSNKTLTRATGTLQNVDIFNVGAWRTAVIGDSTALTNERFVILRDEISLAEQAMFDQTGQLIIFNDTGDADGLPRIQVVSNDGLTARALFTSSGTMAVFPSSTTTAAAVAVGTTESNAESAFQLSDPNGANVRFLVTKAGTLTSAVTTASGASVFSAAANWSIVSASGRRTAGVNTVDIEMSRTSGSFTGGATGSIAAQLVGTLQGTWVPANTMAVQFVRGPAGAGDQGGGGWGDVISGSVRIKGWHTGGIVATGDSVRFSLSFI